MVVLSLVTLLVGAPSVDDLLAKGRTRAQNGNLTGAIDAFRQAYDQDKQSEAACYLGLAFARSEKPARANLFFRRCRESQGTMPGWAAGLAKDMSDALRAGSYTPVKLTTSPAGATVVIESFESKEAFTAPDTVWLPMGEHRLRATKAGFSDESIDVQLQSPNDFPVHIILEPVGAPVVEPDQTSTDVIAAAPSGGRNLKIAGWVSVGLGLAAAVAGGVMHGLAAETRSDASALPAGGEFDETFNRFEGQRTAAYALYSVGGALLGTGLLLALPEW